MTAGLLLQATQRTWTDDAVRDTVSAVLRDPAYRRSIAGTILEAILGWLVQHVVSLIEWAAAIPHGRWIPISILALAGVVAAVRLAVQARREAMLERIRLRHRERAGGDPWQQAIDLRAEGDVAAALHALYRAVVGELAQRHQLRAHSSWTSGDYIRRLRRGAPAGAERLRQFVRRLDPVLYGSREADDATLDALFQLARDAVAEHRQAA